MKFSPIAALLVVILAVTACSASRSGGVADADSVPGVVSPAGPIASAPETMTPGPAVLNSDNRPVVTRSGLNSDPNNPSGAPGRPSN